MEKGLEHKVAITVIQVLATLVGENAHRGMKWRQIVKKSSLTIVELYLAEGI